MNVAFGVRSLSIELYNEHGFGDAATKITESLQSNFPHLREFAERLSQDASTLTDFHSAREPGAQGQGGVRTKSALLGGDWSSLQEQGTDFGRRIFLEGSKVQA